MLFKCLNYSIDSSIKKPILWNHPDPFLEVFCITWQSWPMLIGRITTNGLITTNADWSNNNKSYSTQYDTRETGLLLCLDMYLEASKYEKEWSVRKLGFVYNELASYNLNLISLEETIQVCFTFAFKVTVYFVTSLDGRSWNFHQNQVWVFFSFALEEKSTDVCVL